MLKSTVMNHSVQAAINTPFQIGSLKLPNRLIQGPLAGFSCAPFRKLYYQYIPPAYCVSEMISAYDVLCKHQIDSRYLYRAPEESMLCYQLAGHDPQVMAQAANRLQSLGADIIDLNCGCPKTKIRKKGAGSALLDKPQQLCEIIRAVRVAITIPLTVKLRIGDNEIEDIALAMAIEAAGADAIIVHGRRWVDDYDTISNLGRIFKIKQAVRIPVIANGDIADQRSLAHAMAISGCDAYMISRAGSGNPWLYQQLLAEEENVINVSKLERLTCFITHLQGLSRLESEHQAVLQSKTLVRYYFRSFLSLEQLRNFYELASLADIELYLTTAFLF